ncbi:MAG: acetate/propionate family kinase [Geitlerinemataceae cyanobacterium]
MKILVFNAGSSSHKLCLFSLEETLSRASHSLLWKAQIDWYPQRREATIAIESGDGQTRAETTNFDAKREVLARVLATIETSAPLDGNLDGNLDAVGHRVVHGGDRYRDSTRIDATAKREIAKLIPFAPAHNPVNLEGIDLLEKIFAGVPQFAVFDTAFHSAMPCVAATYPGAYDWFDRGIRRYGFHGISHQYCTRRAAQLLDRPVADLKLITCHLGNGCSLAAVAGGRSVDTTMGFTPLDGLMMGTRSGAIDPGIAVHLLREGMSADDLDRVLNKESGLKGISGVSHDLREIDAAIAAGNERAQLALDLFVHRLKAGIGAMLMSLGGVDAIVFAGGVGEHHAAIRAAACDALGFLGVEVDTVRNEGTAGDRDITTADSTVRVLVVRTQEELEIARECVRQLRA